MRYSKLEPIAEAVWLYAHRQPVIRHEPRGEWADSFGFAMMNGEV
jgi:hypothetical protein